jgi:hypothetical protein
MSNTIIILAFLISFSVSAFAATMEFRISTDESPELKLNPYITDPRGVKAGYLEDGGSTATDLGGGYGIDRIDDDVTPGSLGTASMEINVWPLRVGTYTVTFYGLSDTNYRIAAIYDRNIDPKDLGQKIEYTGFISSGAVRTYSMLIADPNQSPVLVKNVSFQLLRQDLQTAFTLGQLGDDKFVGSLARMVNLAERLAGKCDKRDKRGKKCQSAIAVLNMVVKRLEAANRKCDSKNLKACDEDKDWNEFGREHRKDHDYDDFFKDWDKDEWHKHKKDCKRFVSDEALKIISEDAGWLIKSLGGEVENEHKNEKEKRGKDDK